jgi:hypothetical protein
VNLRNWQDKWQDKWQDGTHEKAERLARLKEWLAQTRQRAAKHGYEADARECERLLMEIRALDPGFEEAH